MESLPEDVAKMAKQFTWRELCLSQNPDILRAQFRMAWEIQSKRNNETRSLPPDIKEKGYKNRKMIFKGLKR
jgi:hypothetical protein